MAIDGDSPTWEVTDASGERPTVKGTAKEYNGRYRGIYPRRKSCFETGTGWSSILPLSTKVIPPISNGAAKACKFYRLVATSGGRSQGSVKTPSYAPVAQLVVATNF